MIYTVTFNPAVDYRASVDVFPKEGDLARAEKSTICVGGKGINVSFVLKRLGVATKALGFVAGTAGDIIVGKLEENDIANSFIKLDKGETRINVKINSQKGESAVCTEINGAGPVVKEKDVNALLKLLDDVTEKDIVVFSGSLPSGMKEESFEKFMKKLSKKKVPFVVDTEGNALKCALQYKPFLVKPNLKELQGISGDELKSHDKIKFAAKKLKDLGAQNVIVSMGAEGALLLSQNNKYTMISARKGKAIDPVGAGDAMVAGFLAGIEKGFNEKESFVLASRIAEYKAMSEGIPSKFRKFY